ncbi:MAG: hypothetical protein V7629_05465 [Motiliproteus sp.]
MQSRTFITSSLLTLVLAMPALSVEAGHTTTHAPRLEQFQQRQGALQVLRTALVRIGTDKQQNEYAKPIAEKSLKLEQHAKELLQQGDANGAQQQLTLALDVVKAAISALRNQEILVRSLNFESPQDEYSYEKQRYESYCMLADLLLKDRRIAAAIKLREQAQTLADTASKQASDKYFSDAVETQEKSNRLVVQAIRRSGVFIPG